MHILKCIEYNSFLQFLSLSMIFYSSIRNNHSWFDAYFTVWDEYILNKRVKTNKLGHKNGDMCRRKIARTSLTPPTPLGNLIGNKTQGSNILNKCSSRPENTWKFTEEIENYKYECVHFKHVFKYPRVSTPKHKMKQGKNWLL